MRSDFVSVVGMEGRGLEEDTPLYVVDVLGTQQGTLATYAQSQSGRGSAQSSGRRVPCRAG